MCKGEGSLEPEGVCVKASPAKCFRAPLWSSLLPLKDTPAAGEFHRLWDKRPRLNEPGPLIGVWFSYLFSSFLTL